MADAESEREIKVYTGNDDYTMYYENGIAVLVPVNSLRMSYSNDRRALVYFSSDRYELVDRIIVNSSSNHVIMTSYVSYTVELFNLKDKQSGENNDERNKSRRKRDDGFAFFHPRSFHLSS